MTISPINSFSYFSTPLRALQLVFAILVTCITSDAIGNAHGKAPGRMVYTLVVAVFSIVMASILLTPFTSTLTLFPLDFLFFILWTMSLKLSPGMYPNQTHYLAPITFLPCPMWSPALANQIIRLDFPNLRVSW